MSTFATPKGWTAARTAEAVVLPRRHLLAIAVLMCVPLPLLSLAAIVVPLPQLVERAAATFISIAAPTLDGEGPVIRESKIAVRSPEIVYDSLEQHALPQMDDASPRAGSAAAARGIPARGGFAATPADTNTVGGSHVQPVEPGTGADDEPGDAGTTGSGGDHGSGDPSTGTTAPSGGQPSSDAQPEPPSSTPPAPGEGGAGSGGSAGGSGGGTQNPPSGGGTPPDNRGGSTGEPGTGSGSPPESPPAGDGVPPGGGRGRP